MSYRAWEPNAIGSIVPPFAGGSGGGGGGGGSNDRFAPKYLVGNVPAGDTATTTGTAAGFTYIADPGDGSGIEAALALCATPAGGDVWIRPGLYDLDSGSVVAPLVIPAKTRVQGAGAATTVRGKAEGVQSVFQLAQDPGSGPAFSQLRDLTVEVPNVGQETSGPEGAIMVLSGGTVINGVSVFIGTAPPGTALTAGILVDTAGAPSFPATSIESVAVTMTRSTFPNQAGSAGIRVLEGQVNGRNITLLGIGDDPLVYMDVGIHLLNKGVDPGSSGGCIFLGSQIFAINMRQYGVLIQEVEDATSPVAARISDAVFVGPGGPTAQTLPPGGAGTDDGAHLEASFVSTFRSVVFFGWSTGVLSVPPNGRTASVQVDDCAIIVCDTGVAFGPGTLDSAVSDTAIGVGFTGAPFPATARRGVILEGAGLAASNNTIHVRDYLNTGAVTSAVIINVKSRIDAVVTGNECEHLDAGNLNALATIYVYLDVFGSDVIVADNHLESDNPVAAIFVGGPAGPQKRITITGNTITLPSDSQPPYGIDVARAIGCTITGNAIDQSSMSSPCAAIHLGRVPTPPASPSKMRCTITGNTIQPSASGAGPAILIDASENACATNACSLDVPPATAAIQITGDNNTCIGNVCLTVPPVQDTGIGNEVAHNV